MTEDEIKQLLAERDRFALSLRDCKSFAEDIERSVLPGDGQGCAQNIQRLVDATFAGTLPSLVALLESVQCSRREWVEQCMQVETALKTSVRLWPFDKAPPELRELSRHGGDEDLVILCPAELVESMVSLLGLPDPDPKYPYDPWCYALRCDACAHAFPDGSVCWITAHA